MEPNQNDPQPTPPAPPADPTPTEPAGRGERRSESNATSSGRFAVYDKAELRFRGRVHESKGKANDAKAELSKPKGVPASRFEVREV